MKMNAPGNRTDSHKSSTEIAVPYQRLRNPVHTGILLKIYQMIKEKPHVHEYKVRHMTVAFPISEGCLKEGFYRMFGISYSDYILQQYMLHATYLLEHTDELLEDIAEGLGFNAISAFSRSYKKYHGISPLHQRLKKRAPNGK